jgi:hypothetical protein
MNNKLVYTTWDLLIYSTGIEIVEENGQAKGVMVSCVGVKINNKDAGYTYKRKEQFYGKCRCKYLLLNQISGNNNKFGSRGYMDEGIMLISDYSLLIQASDCLVDPNIPLRYGLQSAFDGDPSTSYVENTKDDSFNIFISSLVSGEMCSISGISIINGYAANAGLYKANNRVKCVKNAFANKTYTLSDNDLEYQIINTDPSQSYITTANYRGEKYNDTCIAELDFKCPIGWLFWDKENEQ